MVFDILFNKTGTVLYIFHFFVYCIYSTFLYMSLKKTNIFSHTFIENLAPTKPLVCSPTLHNYL